MNTTPWSHGDISNAELSERGLDPSGCVDFAVNVDPQGPHLDLLTAFHASCIGRYPDPRARLLTAALAERDDVPPSRVLVGPGVAGLLWSLCRALGTDRTVLIPASTFSEYAAAAQACRLEVRTWPRSVAQGLRLELGPLDAHLHQSPTALVMLGSPDNPSGSGLDYPAFADLARRHPDALFVLDEAFLRLSDDHERAFFALPANVLRMRSLTKELGMPGLRVGYMVGDPQRLAAVGAQIPPWSVGGPAQAAARAGVISPAIVADARERMRCDTEALRRELRAGGWDPWPTRTVYTLIEVGSADLYRERLLAQGILVRSCTSFGLPRHLRLCGRAKSDRMRLLDALDAVRTENAWPSHAP